MEYLLAFNTNSTKLVIIQQLSKLPDDNKIKEDNSESLLEEGSAISQPIGQKSKDTKTDSLHYLKIFCISKYNHVIMNQIIEKSNTELKAYLNELKLKAYTSLSLQEATSFKQVKQLLNDQDILEIQYLGKCLKMKKNHDESVINNQFLVRRKYILEIIMTNGLSFRKEPIRDSQPQQGYVMSEMIVSHDFRQIIIYYQAIDNPQQISIGLFNKNTETQEYTICQQASQNFFKDTKNFNFDKSGELTQLCIDINYDLQIKQVELVHIQILRHQKQLFLKIPIQFLIQGLLDSNNFLHRVIQSRNSQLLFCGRVVIQLGCHLENIQSIGVILCRKENNMSVYEFVSLAQESKRQQIRQFLKFQPDNIVRFDLDMKPISPKKDEYQNICYFCHLNNELQQSTSIIKLDTESLICKQIYQSDSRIEHLSIREVLNVVEVQQDNIQSLVARKMLKEFGKANATIKSNKENARGTKANNKPDGLKHPQPSEFQGSSFNQGSILGSPQNSSASPVRQSQTRGAQEQEIIKNYLKLGLGSQLESSLKPKANKVNNIVISVLSQNKNQIQIEMILDTSVCADNHNESATSVTQPLPSQSENASQEQKLAGGKHSHAHEHKMSYRQGKQLQIRKQQEERAELIMLINVASREQLVTTSEVCWINNCKFLLTVNNDYYLMNLKHQDWITVESNIQYCKQHVNINLFTSIVRRSRNKGSGAKSDSLMLSQINSQELGDVEHTQEQGLIRSILSIRRMEIASFARFAFVDKAKNSTDQDRNLLFFTPCEELHGGTILQKLAETYDIIKPYLETIEPELLELMNNNVKNIIKYMDKSYNIEDIKQNIQPKRISFNKGDQKYSNQTDQLNNMANSKVHMFQSDISGISAVDTAFQSGSIFCIKALVDSVLLLPNELSFRNCFDKAVLRLINKGLDVGDLVVSELFFPTIWKKHVIFSNQTSKETIAYNGVASELESEDPYQLFKDMDINNKNQNNHGDNEMEFRYIHLAKIEQADKRSIARTLKDSSNMELFKLEAIQCIIDYKWSVGCKKYFHSNLFIYVVYMIVLYWDSMSLQEDFQRDDAIRSSSTHPETFYLRKLICFGSQCYFISYEISQARVEGPAYFASPWNYIEIIDFGTWCTGALLDMTNRKVRDDVRVAFVLSVILALFKFLQLIRCHSDLSLLVQMIEAVLADVYFFLLLFGVFLFTFAESYHILDVDISVYGRFEERFPLFAHFMGAFRASMGEMALLDPKMSFDIIDGAGTPDEHYRHSFGIVVTTFIVYIVGQFLLFMIFMNFIIAVINESYTRIQNDQVSFDYSSRASMISEREARLDDKKINLDEIGFPHILIVRSKRQDHLSAGVNNIDTAISSLKDYVRNQHLASRQHYTQESKTQKDHFTNSIKMVENQLQMINDDIDLISKEVRGTGQNKQMNKTQFRANQSPSDFLSGRREEDDNLKQQNINNVQNQPKTKYHKEVKFQNDQPKDDLASVSNKGKQARPQSSNLPGIRQASASKESSQNIKNLGTTNLGLEKVMKHQQPQEQMKQDEHFDALFQAYCIDKQDEEARQQDNKLFQEIKKENQEIKHQIKQVLQYQKEINKNLEIREAMRNQGHYGGDMPPNYINGGHHQPAQQTNFNPNVINDESIQNYQSEGQAAASQMQQDQPMANINEEAKMQRVNAGQGPYRNNFVNPQQQSRMAVQILEKSEEMESRSQQDPNLNVFSPISQPIMALSPASAQQFQFAGPPRRFAFNPAPDLPFHQQYVDQGFSEVHPNSQYQRQEMLVYGEPYYPGASPTFNHPPQEESQHRRPQSRKSKSQNQKYRSQSVHTGHTTKNKAGASRAQPDGPSHVNARDNNQNASLYSQLHAIREVDGYQSPQRQAQVQQLIQNMQLVERKKGQLIKMDKRLDSLIKKS